MIFPVFIELPAGDIPPSAAVALIDACSAGAAGRVCRLTDSALTAESDVVASVDFTGPEQRLATVRLGLGWRKERTWQTRRLEFRAADESTERWRSVGLVIGALAADYARLPGANKSENGGGPPDVHVKRPLMKAPPRTWWVDGGLVSTAPVDGIPWRGGVYARASLAPWPVPIAATASFRYERRLAGASDFDLELSSGSLGAALRVEVGGFGVEARLEVLRQFVVLSASDDNGSSERRGRWHTGVRGGLDVDLRLGDHFLAVVGADATLLDAPTRIEVRNRPVGVVSSVGLAALLGLRWSSDPNW